ncbi:MAG: GNAT family N-acetyltransferase [Acidimicrobiales bacterium]
MIRFVKNEDWGPWKVLWQGYLDFYREELPEDVSRRTFERLRDQRDGLFGLVAETDEGELVGIANALVHPTTWSEAGYCYLEDLFVTPQARGSGRGQALIEAVLSEARRRGVVKVYWHTQEFNGPARSLYDLLAKRVSFVVYEHAL